MPGTAASNLQSRAHAKARPSANARAASLVANTPVLFRLPLIPNVPTQELPATFADATAGLPTAQLSAVTTGSVAGAAVATASQAAASASAASPHTEATVHAVPTRTWWEHWSSGIVLIVLLIALATASILAWQGGGKPNEKLLADTEQSSEKPFESLSDLSAIEVPKLGEPKLGTEKPNADVLTLPALKSNPATSSQASLQNSSLQQEAANEDSNGSDAEDASSLIPSGPMGLSFDAPTESTKTASKPEATLTPESHATASLQSPIVKQQEPLFKDEPTATRATVSAQPASTPSTMNSSSLNSGSTKSTATGGSPAMWDSSSLNPTDKASTSGQGLSLELSSPTNPASDSNTLGTASKPASTTTTPALLTSQPASTPATTGTTTKPAPSATGPAVPSNINYAGKTNTPELDRAALIATFRQYSSTDMSAPPVDATANRYRAPAPATSTPGLQSPSSPAGTAASMVGFTQQPAQQPTQQQLNQQQFTQQPTQQPNFTLQPNQQPTQQVPPQQNQTLQYPTQQFQNQYAPQGQQPLYQQPQYQPQQTQQAPAQQSFNQQTQFGIPPTTAQQFTAPNTNLNNLGLINNGTTANTGNGYYVPPTAPTNSQPNTLNYPSLK